MKTPFGDPVDEEAGIELLYVGDALVEHPDFFRIDVDAEPVETSLHNRLHQRQADITQPDDGDRRLPIPESREKVGGVCRVCCQSKPLNSEGRHLQ